MPKSCPFGHTCDDCHLQVTLQGVNPNTGLPVDRKDCAIAALALLSVQIAGKTDQVAAAVESTREEVTTGLQRAVHATIRSIEAEQSRPALKAVNADD